MSTPLQEGTCTLQLNKGQRPTSGCKQSDFRGGWGWWYFLKQNCLMFKLSMAETNFCHYKYNYKTDLTGGEWDRAAWADTSPLCIPTQGEQASCTALLSASCTACQLRQVEFSMFVFPFRNPSSANSKTSWFIHFQYQYLFCALLTGYKLASY
jgi:hypothetical protein